MITRSLDEFRRFWPTAAPDGPRCATAAFLVTPLGFHLAEQSATDNRYMAMQSSVDAGGALVEHAQLSRRVSTVLPTISFPGDAATPDAVFPNNVFATAPGTVIIGNMRHEVRRREARRADIRGFFRDALKYKEVDLSAVGAAAELTGSLVIDRARGIGYCGLGERCDEAGAAAMHEAFGLRFTLCFDLAEGEYHTNVVLSVLAGRAIVIAPDGFADAAVAEAIAAAYAPGVVRLTTRQKADYAGNCIALSEDSVWMSARAAGALAEDQRRLLAEQGFRIEAVAMPEIEKAGGSLRCCVGEIY
ncbi:arginine deiminase-related protein [Tahibacter amnicola]|uniref:Arginine deiminase-related protein n=1 Tax=Tahibacter amnicola TaxID=2976241 RepID=A0ABY6BDI7_9GAMM|nr:arginine deiminase-related protein [Tahibacter amnicola]UXI68088.1 arginine deiminase-related protein [Tahibacter amnicola]